MRFLVLLIAPLLVACASIQPTKMVPEKSSYGAHHERSVALDIGGGSPGAKWFSESVTPEQFKEAVRLSIEGSKLFGKIAEKISADYILSANLDYSASHPGANLTAWCHATWAVIERLTSKNIWTKEIKTEGNATMSEELSGLKRQILALERAVKANIESALSEVGALQMATP